MAGRLCAHVVGEGMLIFVYAMWSNMAAIRPGRAREGEKEGGGRERTRSLAKGRACGRWSERTGESAF